MDRSILEELWCIHTAALEEEGERPKRRCSENSERSPRRRASSSAATPCRREAYDEDEDASPRRRNTSGGEQVRQTFGEQ